MDDENPELKWLAQLAALMVEAYDMIAVVLEALPIPIGVPRFEEAEDFSAALALPAITEAYRAMQYEPVSEKLKTEVLSALTDWLNSHETGAYVTIAGPAWWRLNIMSAALLRAAVAVNRARVLIEEGEAG